MRQIRNYDKKNKFGIYKDKPIRRTRKFFRKDWPIERFMNNPNSCLEVVQLSFNSAKTADDQNVVSAEVECAQTVARDDNADDKGSFPGSGYSSTSISCVSSDEKDTALDDGKILGDSDKVEKRAWRSEHPAVAPCGVAVAADPVRTVAERLGSATSATEYRKSLLSLADQISTTEGGMQMLKKVMFGQQDETAQPEVVRPMAQQCVDKA